ncbi:MAG TPA: lipocalin family protein [Bacteroidia bacterium]|nr:lipocalin family protein [Bacteroidia bacterium]
MKLKILLLLVIVSACTAKEHEVPRGSSWEDLIAGEWIRTGYFFNKQNHGPGRDLYAEWDSCEQDDEMHFHSNKTYSYLSGVTRCRFTEPDTFWTGGWGLKGNKLTLSADLPGSEPYAKTISILTQDSLVLTFLTQPPPGDTIYWYYESFRRK